MNDTLVGLLITSNALLIGMIGIKIMRMRKMNQENLTLTTWIITLLFAITIILTMVGVIW